MHQLILFVNKAQSFCIEACSFGMSFLVTFKAKTTVRALKALEIAVYASADRCIIFLNSVF